MKGNNTMKCYKVKFLAKDELRCKLIMYAFSAGQAKALAEAYPLDDITEIKVSVSKTTKKVIELKNRLVARFGGEDILLKREIDIVNDMRIRRGKEPIDIKVEEDN